MDQTTFMTVFTVVIILVLVGILGYLVFYIVKILKPLVIILKNVAVITEKLKREQEFIDRILFYSQGAIENIEETLKTFENVVGFVNGMKEFWQKKKETASHRHKDA